MGVNLYSYNYYSKFLTCPPYIWKDPFLQRNYLKYVADRATDEFGEREYMVAKLFKAYVALVSATIASGTLLKNPALINAGINMGLSSGLSYAVVDHQRKGTEQKLANLTAVSQQFDNINSNKFADLSREIEKIDETLKDYKQQLNKQRGRYFSTDEKLKRLEKKHKQQTTAIAKQVDKLIDLVRDNSQNAIAEDNAVEDGESQSNSFVYIDGNNFCRSTRDLKLKIDYAALKDFLAKDEQTKFKFYDGVGTNTNYPQRRLHSRLKKLGYKVFPLPKVERPDGSCKTIGDDLQIATHILTDVKPGDEMILVSGDGDFFPVVSQVQKMGVRVTVLSNQADLSYILKNTCDRYIDLKDIAAKIIKPNLSVA